MCGLGCECGFGQTRAEWNSGLFDGLQLLLDSKVVLGHIDLLIHVHVHYGLDVAKLEQLWRQCYFKVLDWIVKKLEVAIRVVLEPILGGFLTELA